MLTRARGFNNLEALAHGESRITGDASSYSVG